METLLEYDKKTFDMVIHDTQERILKQIYERRLEEFEMRMEMGGDRGIHFPKHDPPFQVDPHL